jgi:hypothetical protein
MAQKRKDDKLKCDKQSPCELVGKNISSPFHTHTHKKKQSCDLRFWGIFPEICKVNSCKLYKNYV